MISKSRIHLKDAEETYFQHLRFALRYSATCLKAAIMAFIHCLIPAFFQSSASKIIKELANRKRPRH